MITLDQFRENRGDPEALHDLFVDWKAENGLPEGASVRALLVEAELTDDQRDFVFAVGELIEETVEDDRADAVRRIIEDDEGD